MPQHQMMIADMIPGHMNMMPGHMNLQPMMGPGMSNMLMPTGPSTAVSRTAVLACDEGYNVEHPDGLVGVARGQHTAMDGTMDTLS